MPTDFTQLSAARKLRPGAAADLLAAHYVAVYRMARGLCGREADAEAVLRFVMSRALQNLPRWREETAPDRWFYHHTLLASRRAAGKHAGPPAAGDDLLAVSDGQRDPPFLAFVHALRSLPAQQREAFILHHGEYLNPRYLGVAMDCSVVAADAHLSAAADALGPVAGEAFEGLCRRFAAAYANLAPPPENAPAVAHRHVVRHLWPRRIVRGLRWGITLVVLGVVTWYAWEYRERIESYLPK